MTKSEAIRLAKQIETYWRSKGCRVSARVIREEKNKFDLDRVYHYTVRTEGLRNGLPKDATGATVGQIAREFQL